MSLLEELKSKPWVPLVLGGGVLLVLFWLLFWSTPEPDPVRTTRGAKGNDQKEGLYDLKIGSWQNRVDQDLEATRKQIAEVFDALSGLIKRELSKKGPGVFTIPGLLRMRLKRKPATKARKGINPFTKQEQLFKAKPARNVVKAQALKNLKEMVK